MICEPIGYVSSEMLAWSSVMFFAFSSYLKTLRLKHFGSNLYFGVHCGRGNVHLYISDFISNNDHTNRE